MRILIVLSLVWALVLGPWTPIYAQAGEAFPLKGKRVAVYFSKKHFTFDDNYRIPLSQFIKSDQGENAEIEDIKLQTLVALGTLFAQQLKKPSAADSTYFLNEFPELASSFIGAYNSDDHSLEPLGDIFSGTDYIMVLNPFILGSYKTSSVYSRSNRIITEQVVVKTARIRMELFDARTGARRFVFESCIDDRKTAVKDIAFEFHMQSSRTGRFLAKLFTLAVQNMNQGVQNNCESN
ncbi:MAG: hypothetical protein KAY96_03300 [Bacteroidia bacterium]|nr:hypothetical protein [Bacteroidia bacterium]